MTTTASGPIGVLEKGRGRRASRSAATDLEPRIFVNGEIVSRSAARVSVFDHGLLYGDGVFEGIRIYRAPGASACRIFRLDAHLDRMYRSAACVDIDLPGRMTQPQFKDALIETVKANRDGVLSHDPTKVVNYIRPLVTRGAGDLGINPRKCKAGPTVIIIVDHIDLYGEQAYTDGVATIVCETRRNSPSSLDGRIKSCNYLNNILGVSEANRAGVKEGIMLTLEGFVGEGTADNLFIVSNGTLVTPPADLGILEGITRAAVLELASRLDIPAKEKRFTSKSLYTANEAFFTGTGAQIVPVISIDGLPVGSGRPGTITRRLMQEFPSLVDQEPILPL